MTKGYPGGAVSVIEFHKDKDTTDIELKEDTLKHILKHPEIKNRNVSVVSIVGSFRKGKSFLLNWLLRYMYANYPSIGHPDGPFGDPENWMGNPDEPVEGFNWRSGIHRETVGIQFWNDVFLCDTQNGVKNCVILMDTQGMFDNLSSDAENSKLFSLCTLISSLQIYNLPALIQQDHLQHLHFATAYARLAAENDNEKTFQQLLFLIRDWYYPDERAFGFEGGQNYLDEVLEVNEDQHKDLSSVREFIKSSFEKLNCFLMPPPGTFAASKSNFGYAKLEEDFIEQLKILVPGLLAPKNIITKKFNNKMLDGNDLFECIKIFVETFKPNEFLPEPQSIFSLTIERSMNNLIEICLNKYLELVELKDVKCLKAPAHVYRWHEDAKFLAIDQFSTSKKMGATKDHEIFQKKLDDKIEEEFEEWREIALELMDVVKQCFNEYKANIEKENFSDLKTELEVQAAHDRHSKTALDSYRIRDKAGTTNEHAAFLRNLEDEISNEYKKWSEIILNLQGAVRCCIVQYTSGIHAETVENLKTEQDIETIHEKYKKIAYQTYDETQKLGCQNFQLLFKQSLQEEINTQYQNWKKYTLILIKRLGEGITRYEDNTTKKILKTLKTPGDVHKHHESRKRLCMEVFSQSSLAPREFQQRYRDYLDAEIQRRYSEWSDKCIERIHRKNAQKCFTCFSMKV